MLFLRVIIEVITVLFLMGMLGTVAVLILTGIEDLRTILGVEKKSTSKGVPQTRAAEQPGW